MRKKALKILLSVVPALIPADLRSQPKSVGAAFSFRGISAVYEHRNAEDCFSEVSLTMDIAESAISKYVTPGVMDYVTWNILIYDWISINSNRIDFYAGPGVIAGYCKEYKGDYGPMFGVKGRVGIECTFDRDICISLSLNPIIGCHIKVLSESLEMNSYKGGLIGSILPVIGIKYSFGR